MQCVTCCLSSLGKTIVIQAVVASGLYQLAFDLGAHDNFDSRLVAIWREIGLAHDALGTPQGEPIAFHLSQRLFEKSRSKQTARFTSLRCKAAVARHSVPMLKLVLHKLAPETEDFAHLRECVAGLALFYDVIMSASIWVERAAAKEAHDAFVRAGVHLQAL